MTQMSLMRRGRTANRSNEVKQYRGFTQLAQVVLLLVCSFPMACVIPPPLSLDLPDAAPNAAPAVLSVRDEAAQDLVEPGPVLFLRGAGTLALTVYDTDLSDESYIRLFVDYNRPDPTPARASCKASGSGQPRRTTTCDISGVCQTADIGQERLLWVEVFDREPLDSGEPRFRAMPADGLSSRWQFFMKCEDIP